MAKHSATYYGSAEKVGDWVNETLDLGSKRDDDRGGFLAIFSSWIEFVF